MEPICLQGRTVSDDDLAAVRALIAEHPDWHRTALSLHLCQLWNWRNGAGRLKDMAARTLLRKLQARGLVELPPPQRRTHRPCAQAPPSFQTQLLSLAPDPIGGSLESLQPVRLELAHALGLRRRVGQLLSQYHYRGFHGAVGENVQYLARDVRGRELAVMVFGAAAWQSRYGHAVWLAETFVEDRFAGAAYRAAGWLHLGQTTGRTRQDRHHTLQTARKTVWVRPLHPQFRQRLMQTSL